MKWLQEDALLARMLALAGADRSELQHVAGWHGMFAAAKGDVALLPLRNGWRAAVVSHGAVSWSLVAVVPNDAWGDRPCIPNVEFFAKMFPHNWITASRASSPKYRLEEPTPVPTAHRVGFPCFVQYQHGKEISVGLVQSVNDDGTMASALLDPVGMPRNAADMDARRCYPVYRNVLGSAYLFWTKRLVINNPRFAWMLAGKAQSELRKRGIAMDDDIVTADDIQRLSVLID